MQRKPVRIADRTVIGPRREVRPHRDGAPASFDDPYQGGFMHRHEIGQNDATGGGFERGFQDQRIGPVTPGYLSLNRGTDPPAPVVGRSQQRGETSRTVEARPAHPVDGPVAADQSSRSAVPQHRIILDRRGGLGPWPRRRIQFTRPPTRPPPLPRQ